MLIPDSGSGLFIPDPNFSYPGSRIRIRIKELKYFKRKNCLEALGNMIWDVLPGSGSRIRIPDPDLDFLPIKGLKGTGSRIRIRNTAQKND
jgi:hypothetical protein